MRLAHWGDAQQQLRQQCMKKPALRLCDAHGCMPTGACRCPECLSCNALTCTAYCYRRSGNLYVKAPGGVTFGGGIGCAQAGGVAGLNSASCRRALPLLGRDNPCVNRNACKGVQARKHMLRHLHACCCAACCSVPCMHASADGGRCPPPVPALTLPLTVRRSYFPHS